MKYSSIDQYVANVIRAWNEIPDESCRNQIKHLRKIMLDVKRNDGSNIFNVKLRRERLGKKIIRKTLIITTCMMIILF